MNAVELGRLLRMLRMRRRWRLEDLAARSKVSVSSLNRHELGVIASTVTLGRHAAALELRVEYRVIGRGADLARVLDEEHAAIVNALSDGFARAGWRTRSEVSYSEWGERGRVDLMAAHGDTGRLCIVEAKTELADLQELRGSLDVKERLAPAIARRLGWAATDIRIILAVASTRRNQKVVTAHAALFREFTPRSYRGGDPGSFVAQHTLLWIPAPAARRAQWLAGRRRIRVRKVGASRTPGP